MKKNSPIFLKIVSKKTFKLMQGGFKHYNRDLFLTWKEKFPWFLVQISDTAEPNQTVCEL